MKHPRDILLEHHRSAEPKLDAIRVNTLATMATHPAQPARTNPPERRPSFREMLRSLRWHLAGLSAAWVLAAFLNAESPLPLEQGKSSGVAVGPRELVTALRENRRQIEELLEAPAVTRFGPVPEPPAFVPKRRGAWQTTNALA